MRRHLSGWWRLGIAPKPLTCTGMTLKWVQDVSYTSVCSYADAILRGEVGCSGVIEANAEAVSDASDDVVAELFVGVTLQDQSPCRPEERCGHFTQRGIEIHPPSGCALIQCQQFWGPWVRCCCYSMLCLESCGMVYRSIKM